MNLLTHSAINMTRRKFKQIPIVFSPHFDVSLSTKWLRSFFPLFNRTVGKRSIRQVDHLVFNSEFEKSAYEKSVSKIGNSSIIAPGIDWDPIARDRKWEDEIVLMYCGHAIKRKRPDRFVTLISELSKLGQKDGITVRGKFASEGPEKRACMEKAESLGISDYIDWLPFLSREVMVREISSSDYFVLLSDSEAYGISVAEAISLGTPAIISNNTALTEFSSNRGVILIDKPDDMESNAQKIISLRGKETRVETTAETNIVTWDEMGEKLSNMYAKTIHSKG
jgi:glycosyltransferase involved in cell wall biosynthesis